MTYRRHSVSSWMEGQAHAWTGGWMGGWMAGTIMGRNKEWREEESGLPGVAGLPPGDLIWPVPGTCDPSVFHIQIVRIISPHIKYKMSPKHSFLLRATSHAVHIKLLI